VCPKPSKPEISCDELPLVEYFDGDSVSFEPRKRYLLNPGMYMVPRRGITPPNRDGAKICIKVSERY
jgi:hypothetical protein